MTKQLVGAAILLSIVSVLGVIWYLSFSSTMTPEKVVMAPEETSTEPKATETERTDVVEYDDIDQEVEPALESPKTDLDTVVESEGELEEPAKAKYAGTIIYEKLPGVTEVYRPEYPIWAREANLGHKDYTSYCYWRNTIFTNHNGRAYFLNNDFTLHELTTNGVEEIMSLSHYSHYFYNNPFCSSGIYFLDNKTFLLLFQSKTDKFRRVLLVKGDIETGKSELLWKLDNTNDTYRFHGLTFDGYLYLEGTNDKARSPFSLRIDPKNYTVEMQEEFYDSLPGEGLHIRDSGVSPSSFLGDKRTLFRNQKMSPDQAFNARAVGHPLGQIIDVGGLWNEKDPGVLEIIDKEENIKTVESFSDYSVEPLIWTADSQYLVYLLQNFYGIYSVRDDTKVYAYTLEELVSTLNSFYSSDRFGLLPQYEFTSDSSEIELINHVAYDGPVTVRGIKPPLVGIANYFHYYELESYDNGIYPNQQAIIHHNFPHLPYDN